MQIPSKCSTEAAGDVADFSYQPESTSKVYLKLFYGVCKKDSTAGTEHCMLWTDAADWRYMDDINDKVSSRHSLLADAAANNWPIVKYVTVLCLLTSFVLFVFYSVVVCINHEVSWTLQVVAAVTQLLLSLMLALSLGLGLQTDTVKPQMFGNYFYGCNVHAEPGASWWCGVLALVISIFAGFLLLFPYLGGPTWVLKWAKSGSIAPSDGDEGEYARHKEELELDDLTDPFAGIYMQEKGSDWDEELGEGEEWETDEGDEEAPFTGGGGDGSLIRKRSSADSADKYRVT